MAEPSRGSAFHREQRAYERQPLQKNALLIARGMSQRPCQMKDICAGGALVELREEARADDRALRQGEVVLIRILLGEGRSARPHELRARVAHAEQQLFGVSFFNPEPATLNALLTAARTGQPAAAALSESARAQLERLGQQFLGWSATVFEAFLKAADARLLDAASHARDEQGQQLFFSAATVLRKRRAEIRSRYLHELRQTLPAAGVVVPAAEFSQAGEPFDGWLAVKLMAARAEAHFHEALATLQAGLTALAPGQPVTTGFAPASLCTALQRAIAALHLPPPVEKLLHQGFEAHVLANLGNVYELLAGTLGHSRASPATLAGGAPAAPPPVTAARSAAAPPPRSAADFLARSGRSAPPAAATEGVALAALQQLLALQLPGAGAMPTGTAQPVLPVTGADVKRLFTMLKGANEGWRSALEKLVAHVEDERLAAILPVLQQFTADVVEALATASQLGEPARAWLQQLELPLLHTLISDPAFFHSEAHPVRQLLSSLLQLGQQEPPLAEPQLGLVRQWLERIGRSFDAGLQLCIDAQQELAPLLAAQEQASRRQAERVCQSANAEQRLEDARRQVQEELDRRLAGRRVPQPVLTLLDAGWRDLLVTAWLRRSDSNREWQDYLGLVDELLAIGADMHRSFDLRHILRLLKTGLLDNGGLNTRQQKQLLDELKHLLSGPQRLVGEVAWVQLPPALREEADTGGDRQLQKWLARVARLQVDDWLELQQEERVQCLRLAWRNSAGSRFVFVNNRQGRKAGSFSAQELAGLMRAGEVLGCRGEAMAPVAAALREAGFRLYERLVDRLSHDPLTGLACRSEFLRQVERALDTAKRQRARHVLACIRLDQFGNIHNTARAVAEQLLKGVAELLSRALAPRTLVARLDEDEFALLLEDCELGRAQQLFSMRLGELAAMRLNFEGEIYKLTASAGLTELTYTSDTAAHALQAAAEACTDARRHGGNRIQVYRPTAAEQARRDAVMAAVDRLNQALEDERLALRCQRMQPLVASRPEGQHFEILLGMNTDGSQDWPPSEFVQAAERYNRMLAVDRWVMDSTCRWLHDHARQAAAIATVSINLSAHSLQDGQTLGYLFDRLLHYGLPPEKFCFEAAETAAMAHLADTAELMRELAGVGCRIALDDFGIGHAGYRVLRHLPLHYLKIDGALVRELDDESTLRLVQATVAIAHYLGLQAIAENVEDADRREQLQALGVDFVQGYGIERPRWLDSL